MNFITAKYPPDKPKSPEPESNKCLGCGADMYKRVVPGLPEHASGRITIDTEWTCRDNCGYIMDADAAKGDK